MWPFKKARKGGELKKGKLKHEVLRELDKLKKKQFNQDSVALLNNVLRVFLDQKYKIKRSMTNEELINELKEKKINRKLKGEINSTTSKIYSIIYNPDLGDITREEFNELIEGVKGLVNDCSH